jgi:hypothetical protein
MGKRRGNHEGTIYQRADGRWTGQLTIGLDPTTDRPIRKTVYGTTRGQVVEELARLRGEQAAATGRQDMRLGQAIDLWLAGVKSKIEPSSYSRYQLSIIYIKEYIGSNSLSYLIPVTIQQWFADMDRDGLSGSQQRYAGKTLRQVLKRCISLGLVAANPAELVDLPRQGRPDIHPLTREQVAVLLEAARGDPYAALERHKINEASARGGGKGGPLPGALFSTPRRLALTAQTVAALERHKVKQASAHGVAWGPADLSRS